MALQTSGVISLANVQTEFGGVNPVSISEYYGKAAGIPASGTINLSHFYGKSNAVLTLKEVVFNASGTFTMPNGVVNNQIIVGCTGGGGCGVDVYDAGAGAGPGSGRTVSTLTMSPGATATVIVGAGGKGIGTSSAGIGGTSSFTGATSCGGGSRGRYDVQVAGTSGGGHNRGGYSSCAASLSLTSGAVDGTSGLWTAKSYGGPNAVYGGGGCYGGGGYTNAAANTGAGAGMGALDGGSGKVVVWYYQYV